MTWKFTDMAEPEMSSDDLPMEVAPSRPRYPYGLRLCLTGPELVKLGFEPDDLPELGDMLHFVAMATVTSCSTDVSEHGSNCRIELQIEKMSVESESDEFADNEAGE